MEGDDCALVDVHRDARVVERLLRVPQLVPHVGNSALENGAEVARDQRPVYACNRSRSLHSCCVRVPHSYFTFGITRQLKMRCPMPTSALTVSLWPVLETEGEDDLGVVLEELGGERVPPQIIALFRSLLQPLVHLVDPVVGLRDDEWHCFIHHQFVIVQALRPATQYQSRAPISPFCWGFRNKTTFRRAYSLRPRPPLHIHIYCNT